MDLLETIRTIRTNKRLHAQVKSLVKITELMRNPAKTELVFDLDDLLFELHGKETFLRRLFKDPGAAKVIAERRLVGPLNQRTLSGCNRGTLGRAYADHMHGNGLEPDFYRVADAATDLGFSVTRIRQTHDFWHVVNGYDTKMLGEMSLQAFSIAYLYLPTSMVLISAQLLRTALLDPQYTEAVVDAVAEGFRRGRAVRGLFAYDWEVNLKKPLSLVRKDLGLTVPSRPLRDLTA